MAGRGNNLLGGLSAAANRVVADNARSWRGLRARG